MEEQVKMISLIVRGETYEATVERITAHAADPCSPWQKDDELYVWLSFERGDGKHPGGTLGFGVTLPAVDYNPNELLRLIKRDAELELEVFQQKADKDNIARDVGEARQKELDKLASQLTHSLRD